jgi:hypothetical protein
MIGSNCLVAALLLATSAYAQTFLGAQYDPVSDELVVDIAYRGTNPNHQFSLAWDRCQGDAPPYKIAARVVDNQGDDAAVRDFIVRRRFSLRDLKCRPANVTLRIARLANISVFVPSRRCGRSRVW